MGAEQFDQVGAGKTLKEAFLAAVEAARYENGHGGYTGSLAEKSSVTLIQSEPLTLKDARALADKLLGEGDSRIDDKWGPAGAIPLINDHRGTLKMEPAWLFFGWASS